MTTRRDFLMLAHTFKPEKYGIGGWFLSDKLDGQRCFWDGGITRGMLKSEVPWANCDKDERYVTPPVATGLWSRLGNVIHAPDWWLDKLPKVALDGELWHGVLGHGQRQNLSRIIKKLVPGAGWKNVRYYVFDMPALDAVLRDGRVSNPNFNKIFKDFDMWRMELRAELAYEPKVLTQFTTTVRLMKKHVTSGVAIVHPQMQLPFQTERAMEIVYQRLDDYTDNGGEGLMLRKPESRWQAKRSHELLKVKKLDDAEGIVVGYITGRETDKGSKLLGLMGALILNYRGKRLELSGFTDAERLLASDRLSVGARGAREWAEEHPGMEVPSWIEAAEFPRGSKVTFRYRGLSLDGIPTEARYWRRFQ